MTNDGELLNEVDEVVKALHTTRKKAITSSWQVATSVGQALRHDCRESAGCLPGVDQPSSSERRWMAGKSISWNARNPTPIGNRKPDEAIFICG